MSPFYSLIENRMTQFILLYINSFKYYTSYFDDKISCLTLFMKDPQSLTFFYLSFLVDSKNYSFKLICKKIVKPNYSIFLPFLVFFFVQFYKILGFNLVSFLIFSRASHFALNSRTINHGLDHSSKKYGGLPQVMGHP